MNPTVSIVMPVYNVEKYLRECLDSVRAQTFTNWECICVDDGSMDPSPAILDEYAAKDPRFRIIRREHSNAGACRNVGMDQAKGEFLCFLDSDDVFSPWMFETLVSKARQDHADVVACEALWFRDGSVPPSFRRPEVRDWTDRTPDEDWSRDPLRAGTMPWNKVIRREIATENQLKFLEQTSTNDLTFMALALAVSRKTFHTAEPLVGYRQRSRSIQAGKSKNPENYFRAFRAVENGVKRLGRWERLSHAGKRSFFRVFARGAAWEMSTQATFRGYRTCYGLVRENAIDILREGVFPEPLPDDPRSLVRFRAIATGGRREKFRAGIEAVLAPVLGGWSRRSGIRSKIAGRFRKMLKRAFEP